MAKKKSKKHKVSSYDHMQGNPMDVVDHPARNLPDPAGGAFNPQAMAMMPGSPMGDVAQQG